MHSDGNDLAVLQDTGVYQTLAELKREGKILAYGISGKTVEGGLLALQQGDCAMVTYNLGEQGEKPVLDYAASHAKGILIKKALASGHACLAEGVDPVRASFELIFAHPDVYKRQVWIAASTHAGEDEIILAAHRQLLSNHPDALLILVPRHPERFNSVNELCLSQGLPTRRRSTGEAVQAGDQVLLGDTMGELLFLYALADIAFVGGSLVANGGHNLLEPAALGKPVLSGPHLFNFLEIAAQLREAGALSEVENAVQDVYKRQLQSMGILSLILLALTLSLSMRLGRHISTPLLQMRLWLRDPDDPAPGAGRNDEKMCIRDRRTAPRRLRSGAAMRQSLPARLPTGPSAGPGAP